MPLLFRTVLAKISAARINKYGERELSVYKHCSSIYCRRYRECSQRQIPSFKRKVGVLQLHRTQKIKECGIKYGFFVRAKIIEKLKSPKELNTIQDFEQDATRQVENLCQTLMTAVAGISHLQDIAQVCLVLPFFNMVLPVKIQ